jgi:rod shape-determining protein MreB
MKVLRNLFTDHLAIDLGSVSTLVCVPGRGIILNEPSVVALDKYSQEVLTVGAPALKLLGRAPREIEIHRPIRSGAIDNFEVAQKMLKAFLRRVRDSHRRSHLVIGVPGSSTTIEQRSIRKQHDVRAGRVDLIDEGRPAALGAGLTVGDEYARMVVDIGGGKTNIAIVGSGGIRSSLSLNVAGNAMDDVIREYLRLAHSLQIGESTAERIKRELGEAGTNTPPEVFRTEVVGKDVASGRARVVQLKADEVRTALEPVLLEIIRGIQRIIEEAPPEATADIYHYGIMLTGGGALLAGLTERLREELQLQVILADDPLLSVALGLGHLVEDSESLKRAAIRQDIRVWEASPELVVNW